MTHTYSYYAMIASTIAEETAGRSKSRKGVSLQALKKAMKARYDLDDLATHSFKTALRKLESEQRVTKPSENSFTYKLETDFKKQVLADGEAGAMQKAKKKMKPKAKKSKTKKNQLAVNKRKKKEQKAKAKAAEAAMSSSDEGSDSGEELDARAAVGVDTGDMSDSSC